MSAAFSQYRLQRKEIETLLGFHQTLRGATGKGRAASDLQILHKSAIVLLTACWEAYVENILRESASIQAGMLPDHTLLPEPMRKLIAKASNKKLPESQTELYVWFFTGDGWRQIVLKYVEWQIGDLHTPNAKNTREIFSKLLGINDICQCWGRQGLSRPAHEVLDEYLDDRHTIAHGARTTKTYTKDYIKSFKNFLDITVEKTEVEVKKTLTSLSLTLA